MDFNLKARLKKLDIVNNVRIKQPLDKYVYQFRLSNSEIVKAEQTEEEKRGVIAQWSIDHPEKSAELNTLIDSIFNQVEIGDDDMRLDMLFCYAAYGFSPNEYMVYELKDKDTLERKAFISDRESVVIGYHLNDLESMQVFFDKAKTYQMFKQYMKRDAVAIEGEKDRSTFLEFAQRMPVFMAKDVREACGRGIELVNLKAQSISADEFFNGLSFEKKLIVEEYIQQAAVLTQFNRSSVNTVRCTTLSNNGKLIILFCFFRTGRKGAIVDNGGAGGLFIGVDKKTGILNTDAVDEVNRRYADHPDTHVRFKGFQLPEWERLIEICMEAAQMIPEVRMIGWDLAYTNNGWIMVEGNPLTEMIGPQSTSRKGFRIKMEEGLQVVGLSNMVEKYNL